LERSRSLTIVPGATEQREDRASQNGEEACWPLFDVTGEALFPELMAELDAIKKTMVSSLVFRRDHKHRKSRTPALDHSHAGFTEGADSDLTDAELRAAGRHRSHDNYRPCETHAQAADIEHQETS
jgi:hypothetical protein